MRTQRQGSSELCFPHKGKKTGEGREEEPVHDSFTLLGETKPYQQGGLEEERGGVGGEKRGGAEHGSSMFRARCPARHTWELSPLYWPSLRVRTQYRVFLGFTHSLELLLLLNSPRKLRHHGKGGEEAGTRREGFSTSLHFNSGRKNRKILSFFGFPSKRTSSLHLLFEEQEEGGRKGIRKERTWVLPRAESSISTV